MPVHQLAPPLLSKSLDDLAIQPLNDLKARSQPEEKLQLSEVEAQAFDSPSTPSTPHRRVSALAGVMLAVATGAIAQVTADRTPEYEGEVQLSIDPITLAKGSDNLLLAQALRKNISAPEDFPASIPNAESRIKLLKSPRMINPVIEKLRAEDPTLDYTQFTNKLHITLEQNNQVSVSYRDTDPDKVKQVLEQLVQRYQVYSQDECHDSACRGVEFIEAQIPQIKAQITTLQADIQQLYQQHNISNLPAESRQFSIRTREITKQQADIDLKLTDAQAQYALLKDRLALAPDDQTVALLLHQDAHYQDLLQQLIRVEKQMAAELGNLTLSQEQLEQLYTQYQTLLTKIHQETVQVLQRYLSAPTANLQNPLFHEPVSLAILQQSIKAAHNVQVLAIRRQSLTQIDQRLTHHRKDLATLLRQDSELRQQLQTAFSALQQYQDELERLQIESPQRTVPLQVLSAPELIKDKSGEPAPIFHNRKHNLVTGASVGVLLGMGAAVLTTQKRDTTKQDRTKRLSRYGRKPIPAPDRV